MRGLFTQVEKDRRETQKQNIVTGFNMFSNSVGSALMNPKLLARSAYLMFIGFGAFHFTRVAMAIATGLVMARFGKP